MLIHKAMSTPTVSGLGPPQILVGTLNLLGDAFNPFEFLPLSDGEMMKHHGVLKAKFQELRWSEVEEASRSIFKDLLPKASVEEALGRLQNHCQSSSLFLYFDKEALKLDNKFIENRTNLLTMALMPCGNGTQCDMLVPGAPWMDRLRNQVVSDAPDAAYSIDPNLFLWDLVCNVVATFCKPAYEEICRRSSLNPVNYEAVGNRFFAEVDARNPGCLPVALGFEEFPSEGTARGRVYESVLEKRNYQLVRGPGNTAIVYRGFAHEARILSSAPAAGGRKEALGCIDPEAIMRSCIDAAAEDGVELSDGEKNGFMKTTARKTLALQLASIVFMVVHVKEPKTSAAASVLARYIRSLGVAATSQGLADGTAKCNSWVLMTDSNLASAELANDFKAILTAESLGPVVALMPEPRMMTTSKHRSVIHGQCYDKAKCEKTVVAPKDYIIASQIGSLQECRVGPSIENGSATTLPTPDWGSDHCLVTAVYRPFGKTGSRVLEAFREADKTGTGEMHEEDLRTLFRCLGRIILSNDDIDAMLKESGASSSGKVKYTVFLQWIFKDL